MKVISMKDIDYSFVTYSDSLLVSKDNSYICHNNLFVIIDGAGRDYPGKKAAALARETILETFLKCLDENNSPGDAIFFSLKEANRAILEERLRIDEKMAASVCMLYIQDSIMYFSHLGDARIYVFQGSELNQLTRDHTIREEDPFAEKRYDNPRALQALVKGLGIHDDPEIYIKKYPLDKKGNIILTTERLTERITNRDLLWLSKKIRNSKKLGRTIVELFRRKGGERGFTLGIIRFGIVPKWLKKVFSIYLIYSLVILAIVFGYVSVYHDDSPRKTGSLVTAPVTVQDLTSEGTDTHSTRGAGAYEPENGSAVRHPIIIEKKKEPAVIKPSAPESKTDVKAPEGSFVAAQGITEKSDVIGTGDIEKEIEGFLMKWKDAWEESAGKDGDISPYLSHYSDEFRSGKFDKKGWASDKSKKNRAKKWIRIGLSEIRVSELVSGNEVKVRFRQEYRSSNFSVKSGKIMQLKKVDGRWLIISEKSG